MEPDIRIIDQHKVLVVTGYGAFCTLCNYRVWVFSGYVLYWVKTCDYKGGAGWSPGATYCPNCVADAYFAQGPGTMKPLPLADQETYHAVHRLGGEPAVLVLMAEYNASARRRDC